MVLIRTMPASGIRPSFTPGAGLGEISPWAIRIEGMLTRINVRLLASETRTTAALSGGLDASTIRQEISTLRDQAIAALSKTAEVVETNIRGTQDAVQLEFNKHRAAIKELDQSVNEIIANATDAFEQQKVDLVTSHQTNMEADRLMRDQLTMQFENMKKADTILREQLAQSFAEKDTEIKQLQDLFASGAVPPQPPMASPSPASSTEPKVSTEPKDAWTIYNENKITGGVASPDVPPGFGQGAPSASAGMGHSFSGAPKLRDLAIMGRDWNNHKILDLHLTPEAFEVWRMRALDYLTKDRPDVKEMLVWAETQSEEILGGTPHKGVIDPTPPCGHPRGTKTCTRSTTSSTRASTGSWSIRFSSGPSFAQEMVWSYGGNYTGSTKVPPHGSSKQRTEDTCFQNNALRSSNFGKPYQIGRS